MQATVKWIDAVHFEATAGSGKGVLMDGPEDAGGKGRGARPMEVLLMGMGGCASYDVVFILKKSRQDVTGCVAHMSAKRADEVPAVFTDIHIEFEVSGKGLKESIVKRAVSMSAEKYCSASIMLAKGGVNITHSYKINEV